MRVAEHLVFVDDEQARTLLAQEIAALGFQRCDDHARVRALDDVARADADIPTDGAPLGKFVIRQRPGRHREHRLSAQRRVEQFENVRLARAGRCVDDHVAPVTQRRDGLLLPEIRDAKVDL